MSRRPLALALVLLAVACTRRSPPSRPPEHEPPPAAKAEPRAPEPAPDDAAEPAGGDAVPQDTTPPGTIAREDLERALSHGPGWLLRELAPEAERADGRFVGWRIGAVFPDAPELCAGGCDLRTGDVIVSVEGDKLETPTALQRLFERADELSVLHVVRIRDGQREQLAFHIVARPLPDADEPR